MRAFQALCVALTAVACRAQLGAYRTSGYTISSAPAAIHTSYAPSVISAAPAVFTRTVAVHSSPSVTVAAAPIARVAIAAAPITRVAYAPAPVTRVAIAAAPVRQISVAAAPVSAVNLGVVAAAPAARVQSHEIHTTSGRQAIRIEEHQAGDQVIRVHEAPQAGPQIAQIRVPGEQHHVRVVNHQAGPAEVQRIVHRQQTQVFDVQKPGRPGARIVQVVKDESPAPTIEFVNAGGSNHHVYHANDISTGHSASSGIAIHSGSAALHVASAPALHVASAPALHVASAPALAVHHSPVVSIAAAPVSTSIISAPSTVLSGSSYGTSYGRAIGSTVVLHKKA